MGYLTIRGNLGTSKTFVYGLNDYEKERLFDKLRRGPKTEDLNEVQFFNPPMTVINQLEFNFGYEVVSCTGTDCWVKKTELTMWTVYKPDLPEDHRNLPSVKRNMRSYY